MRLSIGLYLKWHLWKSFAFKRYSKLVLLYVVLEAGLHRVSINFSGFWGGGGGLCSEGAARYLLVAGVSCKPLSRLTYYLFDLPPLLLTANKWFKL